MFNTTITSVQDAITRLKNVKDGQEFSLLLSGLRNFLKTLDIDSQCLMELEQRAYYLVNEYSDKETRDNLDAAAKRVIEDTSKDVSKYYKKIKVINSKKGFVGGKEAFI